MKYTKYLLLVLNIFFINTISSQEEFTVEIEPLSISNAPNVHSFSWGETSDGKWVIIGGRIDGLHQRQPFAAFLESSNNKNVTLIDVINNQTWSTSLQVLPITIYEQLQSTNQEFHQRDNTLYIMGGYGYSASQDEHITYPNLTAIDIDGLADAIMNNENIASFFRQITYQELAVTGGQLDLIGDMFLLCGGQFFEGRYNPIGPNGGTGFVQEYSDEIRKFEIIDDGINLSIENYNAINDPTNLHRRDYNMVPQIFPNGERGTTMFSGVFQPNVDLPFLNSVDVTTSNYTVNNNFTQYLSQYHSAKVPIYDATGSLMHTIFFGGMSQYKIDANGNLIQDNNVPFVNTISRVTRANDGSMTESKLGIEMPGLLGSGAEFIPISDSNIYIGNEIVDLNNLPEGNTLIGYIYGGIDSTQENIFFINDGTQSSASNQIYKVYINKGTLGIDDTILSGDNIFDLKIAPNPSNAIFAIDFFVPNSNILYLKIINLQGKLIEEITLNKSIGRHKVPLDLSHLSAGEYIVSIESGNYTSQKKIIKE